MKAKKILAGVMTVAVLFGGAALPAGGFLNDGTTIVSAETEGDWEYKTTSESCTITKYNGDKTKVDIPAKLGGKPVTVIGSNCFYNNSKITQVTMPDTVETIGMDAFFSCFYLKDIKFSKNLKYIKSGAFEMYTIMEPVSYLQNIDLPEGLLEVETYAFRGCNNLKEIVMPESVVSIGYCALGYNCFNSAYSNVVIKGYGADSAAAKYAKEGGFKYVDIDESSVKLGDVDLDGRITQSDATYILREIMSLEVNNKSVLEGLISEEGKKKYPNDYLERARRNGDVDSSAKGESFQQVDATYILRAILESSVNGNGTITDDTWKKTIK